MVKMSEIEPAAAKQAAEKLRRGYESPKNHPSTAKAVTNLLAFCGTTEVVPFQNGGQFELFRTP